MFQLSTSITRHSDVLLKPHSHPNGFCWGYQCLWPPHPSQQHAGMELISRRRWRLISAQLSNTFGYQIMHFIVLLVHKHNSLPLGQIWAFISRKLSCSPDRLMFGPMGNGASLLEQSPPKIRQFHFTIYSQISKSTPVEYLLLYSNKAKKALRKDYGRCFLTSKSRSSPQMLKRGSIISSSLSLSIFTSSIFC